MKKRNIKKAIVIIIFSIIAAAGVFMVLAPQIPVQDCTTRENIFGDRTNDAYDVAYNVYGKLIFKNKRKALKQFKKDYAVTLEYLNQCGYGEFNTSYDTLSHYAVYSWQHNVESNVENKELIESQLGYVSSFIDLYYNSNFHDYYPFYKPLS